MATSKKTEREAREARDRARRYAARQAVHQGQIKRRFRDNLIAVGGLVVVAALATTTQVFYFSAGPGMPTPEPSASEVAEEPATGQNVGDVPDPSVAEDRIWDGTLTLNDVPLGIAIDGILAPQAAASFIVSAQTGYYLGTACHRLVKTETAGLIQCGSLDGSGASDPSYSFGPIENPGVGGLYPAGTIAMARVGNDAYSQGRQIFIVFEDTMLPDDSAGGYSIIGTVTSGLDSLKALITDAGTVGEVPDGPPLIPTNITGLTLQ